MGILEKFRLQGKVALVTGAGKNLGKVIALLLAEAGADVAVASRTLSETQETAEEIRQRGQRALAFAMDVTDFKQVEKVTKQVASEFGRIDILVNNAATRSFKSILEMSEGEWRNVIDTNLTGAFLCCKAAGPLMIQQGGGRVINIASGLGFRGAINRTAYCASKGGLILLTRALALEWAPYNIFVNAVAPGLLTTAPIPKESLEARAARIPLKRAGTPDEIASLVVYIASDACTLVNGFQKKIKFLFHPRRYQL